MKAQNRWNQITSMFFILSLVTSALVLQGCGSGGSSTPPPPPAPSLATAARGYYDGFATITVPSGTDLTINSPDFQAMADGDKLVIVSQTDLLFYNITFTDVTATTFKASVRVYKDGIFVRTTSIDNGAIVEGSSLKGTFTGTGDYANGTFDLGYSTLNVRAPLVYADNKSWQDGPPNTTGNNHSNTNTNFTMVIAVDDIPAGLNCRADNFDVSNVNSEQPGRLRRFISTGLTGCGTNSSNGLQLTGFFTNFDGGGGTDDRLLLITFNDDLVYTGILPCLSATCF